MTLFWSIAAAMTAAALLFVLPPLLRARRAQGGELRQNANASIYREQLEELLGELQSGALSREEYERASREIERRVLAEHGAAPTAQSGRRPAVAAAIAVAVLLPLAAGVGYWQLGNHGALDAEAMSQIAHATTREQMASLVERLSARMEQKPDDAEGWMLLGRSLSVLGQYERSAQAYARAAKLVPDDAALLADYADVLAMARGQKLEGEPFEIVKRALALDPQNIKALALAGSAEFERHKFAAAIGYWEKIIALAPPDSEFARSVAESIAQARELSGKPAIARETAKEAVKEVAKAGSAKAGTSLQGVVSLDPSLAARAAPGDTVFVLARPAGGARMPLAVARITVAQLPYRFTLDDSMAMAAGATISSQAKVVVVARISKSGSPSAQKGDVEGASEPVAPGASNLKVVMSRVVD